MATAHTAVRPDGDTAGRLPDGTAARFNATADDCECCGEPPLLCVWTEPDSVRAEFNTATPPIEFSLGSNTTIVGGELVCELPAAGGTTFNSINQEITYINRPLNDHQIFESEIRFKYDSFAGITGVGPDLTPNSYVFAGFGYRGRALSGLFLWEFIGGGGLAVYFYQDLFPSDVPEYATRKGRIVITSTGFADVVVDIAAPGLSDDAYHTMGVDVGISSTEVFVDGVLTASVARGFGTTTCFKRQLFTQNIDDLFNRTRNAAVDVLKIDYLRLDFIDPPP